ncbi:hypothetical protein PF002_g16933 [Phytophthora fragariae]|uniref:Uncharacterized protein n=1 Tax=Phytophthora fragariae TaxID=53985 RepID=A0A6A3YER0_9STRA|nr:hypothetical protein PF002_g16933 [Phytophthora fragariae]
MGGRPRANTTITGTSPRNASCARPEAGLVVGGGVHGVGGGAEAKEVKLPLPRSRFVAVVAGDEDGGGAEAKEAKLPLPRSSGGEDGGGAEAKEAKLPLPRSSGGEVGVGVRAKEAKLRLQGCTPVSVVTCRVDLELLIEQCTTFS